LHDDNFNGPVSGYLELIMLALAIATFAYTIKLAARISSRYKKDG